MTSDRVAAAAKVIAEYTNTKPDGVYATYLARDLDDEGLLAPEMQEPVVGEESGIADWYVNNWEVSVYPDPNPDHTMVHIDHRNRLRKPYVFHPSVARQFGEALLAAADYAEKEEQQ